MAEEIVAIRLISGGGDVSAGMSPSGGSSASASAGMNPAKSKTAGGKAGIAGSIGGAMKGAMMAVGIGSVVGIVVTIASQFKGLISMVSGIVKMISLFLKPIADVVMIFLRPILVLLKPIVQMVNQIMAPYIRLSMEFQKKGIEASKKGDTAGAANAFALSGATAIQGLGAVGLALGANVLKMTIDIVGDVIEGVGLVILEGMNKVAQFLSPDALGLDDDIQRTFNSLKRDFSYNVDTTQEFLKKGIDTAGATIMTSGLDILLNSADEMGIKTKEIRESAAQAIRTAFTEADDSIAETLIKESKTVRETGVEAVKSVFDAMQEEFEKKSGEAGRKASGIPLRGSSGAPVKLTFDSSGNRRYDVSFG